MNQHYIQKQKEFQDAQKLTQQEIHELQERQKFEPIYSPRTSLKRKKDEEANLLSELLLKLDPFTISILNNDFEAAGGELKVNEFVIMMRHHLSDWKQDLTNREQKLNICLINLFEQMDLNLNGLLEWEELANYVMGKATIINNKRKDVVKQYTKQDVEINYKVKSSLIKKVIFITDIDKVAFFEEGSNVIQIMNHENGTILPKPLKVEPDDYLINSTSIKKDNQDFYYIDEKIIEIKMQTHILDAIYITDKKHKCLMVSTTDKFVRAYKLFINYINFLNMVSAFSLINHFYFQKPLLRFINGGFVPATELKNNQLRKIQMIFRHEVNCMSWDESREILYCGELDGSIELWNLNSLDNEKEENSERLKKKEDHKNIYQYKKNVVLSGGHSDIITSILSLPKLQFTVSAGLDCKIILWDTIENKMKIAYKGHTRGITSLAYDPATILLFSAGFDHWIGVWNPYTDHMVYKIADYRNSLQHILVIEGSNQLISLDIKGNIKVRDIQKFKEKQTFSLDQDEHGFNFNPVYFTCVKTTSLKLIFCGQSIAAYNYDYGFNPNVCDDLKPLCCIMNTRQLKFYTPAGPRIKIWCALTGEVDKIFLDMSHENTEISAFCLDFYQKRIIIGDKQGYVSSFNCENGAKIMAYPRHSAPVIFIKDCLELEIVVTVSSDNTINIVSNNYSDEKDSLLRSIKIVEHYITCIDLYVEYSSIVLGFYSGQIGFFDMTSGKFLGQYSDSLQSSFQITDVLSLPDIPFVVASSQNGSIKFISGPPLFYRFQVVESFQNIDQELYNIDMELEDVGVSKIKYCKQNQHLFVGDFKGYLKCYDISKIIKNLNENIEQSKRNIKMKEDKHTLYKSMREYFQFNLQTEPKVIWNVKATSDQITSLEYNNTYKLLFICTSEKNVMIFDSIKGQYIEQLRQNEDNFVQKPIGYRMKNTIDLYDHSLKFRIDRTKEEDEQIEKQKQQEYLSQMKKKIKQQKKMEMLSGSIQSSQLGQSYLDSESSKEDRSTISNSKGIQASNNLNSQILQNGIAEIKEELNESENHELSEENHKNIFITISEKKSKHSEVSPILSQLMGEDSIRSIEEVNKSEESDEDEQKTKNEIKSLDDRIVCLQYPECEFDAFFFCNLIKKEPYTSMKSKPQWKLELDFRKYYDKYLDKIRDVESSIIDLEKKTKVIQIRNQKFKIVRFEVDLQKFDPQKNFQPRIAISQKDEVLQAEEETLDAKAIAANYQKKLQEKQDKKEKKKEEQEIQVDQQIKQKLNYNQVWENLSKNKVNCRNYDSEHFLQVVQKKIKLSREEQQKLIEVYQALKDIENLEGKKNIVIKQKKIKKEETKKEEVAVQKHQQIEKKESRQSKELNKSLLASQVIQGRRGLIKLKQQSREQNEQYSSLNLSKSDNKIASKRVSLFNDLEQQQNQSKIKIEHKIVDYVSTVTINEEENQKQQEQKLLSSLSIEEKLVKSQFPQIQNYLKLLKEQQEQQNVLQGSQQQNSIKVSNKLNNTQISHVHQNSVTNMISQAFSIDQTELDLDSMVKRITDKFDFNKTASKFK